MLTFKDECYALLGEYGGNWKTCVYDSTDIIFNLKDNNNHELMSTKPNKLITGKFYLMKYEYIKDKYFEEKYMNQKNVPSLKIWCPVFVLGFKESDKVVQRYMKNKKLIMYAINLDYLPYRYRILFFDMVFNMNFDRIEKNKDLHFVKKDNVLNEWPLKVSALKLYNLLKNNGGFEYSLTAYDPDKIDKFTYGMPELYSISTTIAQRLMFLDCKLINKKNIIETLKESETTQEREKLKSILDALENILNTLDKEEKELYKKLRQLENYFEIV